MFSSTTFVLLICSSTLVFGQGDLEALQQHVNNLDGKMADFYTHFSEEGQSIRADLSNEMQDMRQQLEEKDGNILNNLYDMQYKMDDFYTMINEEGQRIRDDLTNGMMSIKEHFQEQDNYLMNEIAAKTSILFDQVGNNQHQLWEKASNQEVNDIMVSLKEQDLQIQDDMSYKMDHVYKDLQEKIDDNRNEISELYSDLQNSNDALRNEMYEFVAKEVAKMG